MTFAETTTVIWAAAFGAFGAIVVAGIAAWTSAATRREAKAVREAVQGVHRSVNSKMDALLAEARALARLEGRDDERDRAKREGTQ